MMLGYTPNSAFAPAHYPASTARLAAVVSWFGPGNLDSGHSLVQSYLANAGADGSKRASPITYVSTAVPTLFVHGTNDNLVSISQSQDMQKALTAQHIDAEFLPIQGAGHGFPPDGWTIAINKTLQFIDAQFAKKNR